MSEKNPLAEVSSISWTGGAPAITDRPW